MPKIKEYTPDVSPFAQTTGRSATADDFGAGVGTALMTSANEVEHGYKLQKENEDRADVSNVHAVMSKARADWTIHMQDRAQAAQPGDMSFAQSYKDDLAKYLGDTRGVAKTMAGQQTFDKLAADLNGDMTIKAAAFQAASAGAKAKLDYVTGLEAAQVVLQRDPTQFDSIVRTQLAAIQDPNGQFARMDPAVRASLIVETKQRLGQAQVQGLIPGMPELAKKLLDDPKMTEFLDPKQRQEMERQITVSINAKDTAAERMRLEQERALKDAQKVVADKFLSRVVSPSKENGGALTDREILADPTLDWNQKQHFIEYKLRRARELKGESEARTNPAEVRSMMLEIHAADDDPKKTYNMDGVMDRYKAGKISTQEMMLGRREVEQMRDGNTQGLQKQLYDAKRTVHDALTRSIEGSARPEVAADASYRFSQDLEAAVAEKRKKNENPRVLLDPTSKEYMLSPQRIKSYMPSGSAVLKAGAAKVTENNGGAATSIAKSRDAAEPGQQYTAPDGSVRTRGR